MSFSEAVQASSSNFHGDQSYMGTTPCRGSSSASASDYSTDYSTDMSSYTPDTVSASTASDLRALPPMAPLPRPVAYPMGYHPAPRSAADDEELTGQEVRLILNYLIGAQQRQQDENGDLRSKVDGLTRWTAQLAAAHNEVVGRTLRMERVVAEQDMAIRRLVAYLRVGAWWAL